MTQRGEHTWDLAITYHRCPRCGFILENREIYDYRAGAYYKDLECQRCHHKWTVKKPGSLTIGPLIGEPEPAEVEWGD